MNPTEEYAKLHLADEVRIISTSRRLEAHTDLTVQEKALIYKYSEDGYEQVNELLRISKGENFSKFGQLLLNALRKLPNYIGLVYRRVELSKINIEMYQKSFEDESELVEHHFISTSKSKLIAMSFKGNTLFIIFSKRGKDIEELAKFGVHDAQNEKEVLLLSNSKFRVLEIENKNQYTQIVIEEV